MIDMQLIGGVLTALAVLVGLSIAISLAMWATRSAAQTGQTPPGGIRRDPPRQPQPDPDDARELVLV
jgi:hypothetical protein